MKKNSLKILVLLVVAVGLASCQNSPTNQRIPSGRSETQGPIDDCLDHAYLYARYDGLQSECTTNYIHYFPNEPITAQPPPTSELRIGSFNLFHLGDNHSSLKNFSIVAQIMNQWDVVAAQELMPLSVDLAASNLALRNLAIKTGDYNEFIEKKWYFERPGYLVLLNELRQLDPSWSLILQATAEGEGVTGEMAGFYYRSSMAGLKEWSYCPAERSADIRSQKPSRNLGCLVQIPDAQKKLISRRAFAAYFKSGNFDFVGLTAHVRFRPADLKKELNQQTSEICKNHQKKSSCDPTKETVGRYYEVKAVADQIKSIQKEAKDLDVIYMGDFNLELNEKTEAYWNASLKSADGFEVFQKNPTTLAIQKEKLLSNYDHFIFNPKNTPECQPESVKTYDFTSQEKPMTDLQKTIAEATTASSIKKQIDTMMDEVKNFAKAKTTTNENITVTGLEKTEIEEHLNRFQNAATRIKTNYTGALLELISDHIPIEMKCRTDIIAK